MDAVQTEIVLAAIVSGSAALGGKIVWDWFSAGRAGDAYLKREEFLRHKSECCVMALKSDFITHKEHDGGVRADIESRLKSVEKRLDQGREDFTALRKDIAAINKSMARITAILEFKFGPNVREGDHE
jgi:septal ring factor EnvC (AmiA/AmiB activator)